MKAFSCIIHILQQFPAAWVLAPTLFYGGASDVARCHMGLDLPPPRQLGVYIQCEVVDACHS